MRYAKSTGGFYSPQIHGNNIPPDAVEITADEHAALLAGQSAGKIISADADGKPFLADPPILPPVIPAVTPWQIRKALNQTAGLRASVEAAVAQGSQEIKDGWEFAIEFSREDPLVEQLGFALGKTSAELDAIFQLAATL